MRKMMTVFALCAGYAMAQKVDLSPLDKLRDKAEEVANVDLDKDKLGLASSLLGSDKPEQRFASGILGSLTGVYVRAYEFENEGAYSAADLDAIRKQLKGPGWTRIVDVKDKKEVVEVYVHNPGKPDQGMLVIAAEPKELSVVNIIGTTDLAKLGMTHLFPKMPDAIKGNSKGRNTKDEE